MNFYYPFIYENLVKLMVSLLLGSAIGAEREYKGRNVGFRTIILITLVSTLFTILSKIIGDGNDPSRVASNIITGVGFLGAGAIFRDGITVKGVTTASVIWISAAIGMACGIAQYEFAVLVTITVLTVLLGFAGVQKFIDKYNKEMVYKITIHNNAELKKELEARIPTFRLKFDWLRQSKEEYELVLEYEIRGPESSHESFIAYLSESSAIKSFEV